MLLYWLEHLTLPPHQLLLLYSSFPPWLLMTGTRLLCAHLGLPWEPCRGLIGNSKPTISRFLTSTCRPGPNFLQWQCSHLTPPRRASGRRASPGQSSRGWSPWPPPPWPTSTLTPSPFSNPTLNAMRRSYISGHCRCQMTIFKGNQQQLM